MRLIRWKAPYWQTTSRWTELWKQISLFSRILQKPLSKEQSSGNPWVTHRSVLGSNWVISCSARNKSSLDILAALPANKKLQSLTCTIYSSLLKENSFQIAQMCQIWRKSLQSMSVAQLLQWKARTCTGNWVISGIWLKLSTARCPRVSVQTKYRF